MSKHKCNWDTVEWEEIKGVPYYYVGGLGETLERNGKCKVCGRTIREVYLHSCYMDNGTDDIIDFPMEE